MKILTELLSKIDRISNLCLSFNFLVILVVKKCRNYYINRKRFPRRETHRKNTQNMHLAPTNPSEVFFLSFSLSFNVFLFL